MPADPATKLLARAKLRGLERLRDAANKKTLEAYQEDELGEAADIHNQRYAVLEKMVRTLESAIAKASDNLQENVSACEQALERFARDYGQEGQQGQTGNSSNQKL